MSNAPSKSNPQLLTVAPGVVVRRRFTAREFYAWPSMRDSYSIEAVIAYDDAAERFVCESFTVSRQSGRPVSGELIRRVPVERIVVEAVHDQVRDKRRPKTWIGPWGCTPPDGLRDEGPTEDTLRWVAHLHRIGHALDGKPAKYVEQQLGIPQSTAGRWIATALRPPTERK